MDQSAALEVKDIAEGAIEECSGHTVVDAGRMIDHFLDIRKLVSLDATPGQIEEPTREAVREY